jgi:hypothetical protein
MPCPHTPAFLATWAVAQAQDLDEPQARAIGRAHAVALVVSGKSR